MRFAKWGSSGEGSSGRRRQKRAELEFGKPVVSVTTECEPSRFYPGPAHERASLNSSPGDGSHAAAVETDADVLPSGFPLPGSR